MSGKAGRHDVWVLAIMAGLFTSTGFVVAPVSITDPVILGYIGSVAGGVAGGAMTVFAGWLAWIAAQKQINTQKEQIQLMETEYLLIADEHRKRQLRALRLALSTVQSIDFKCQVNIAVATHKQSPAGRRGEYFAWKETIVEPIDSLFDDEDMWRIDDDVLADLHLINERIQIGLRPPLDPTASGSWENRRAEQAPGMRSKACEIARKIEGRIAALGTQARTLNFPAHPATPPAP